MPMSSTTDKPTRKRARKHASKYEVEFSICLGSKLRRLRKERGLTQEAVAHASGIAVYTYQKFEKGMSKPGTPMNPTLATLHALCRVFDTKLTDLLDIEVAVDPSGE